MKNKYFRKVFAVTVISLFASLLFVLPAYGADHSIFTDVDQTHQNAVAIEFLKDNLVVVGYDDGSFGAELDVNRAEFLKIVMEGLAMVIPDPLEDCFPDFTKEEWFGKYVCEAKRLGWVQGYDDGLFRPGQGINKVEALKILAEASGWDLSGFENVLLTPFADVDSSQWYWEYLIFAIEHQIIEETGNSYEPGLAMTRGKVAEYMYRDIAVRVLGLDEYDPVHDAELAERGLIVRMSLGTEWDEVAELVRTEVISGLAQSDDLIAFMWQDAELAGTEIAVYDIEESDYKSGERVLDGDTWFVFIDLAPGSLWEHDSIFVYIDAETMEYEVLLQQSYPVIDDFGLWNTEETRMMADFWVYPLNNEFGRLAEGNLGTLRDDDGIDVSVTIDDYEAIQAANLAGLQQAEADDPKDAEDFESQCKDLPFCENKTGKKLGLVVDGHGQGDSFKFSGMPIYKALLAQGFDVKYLAAAVGENKEHFDPSEFPADEYPEGPDVHKDNMGYVTLESVAAAFQELAGKVNDCCDEVVIYLGGHGSTNGSINFNGVQTRYKIKIDPNDRTRTIREPDGEFGDEAGGSMHTNAIKAMLDEVKTCDVTVLISSCYSGKHIDNGINEDIPQDGCICRTVYTSSTAERPSWGSTWGSTFAGAIGEGKSMSEAALDAHNSTKDQGYSSNFTQVSSTPPTLCTDADGDGFCAGTENGYGTDPDSADTDGDLISDFDEIIIHGTNPLVIDTDGDGLSDSAEINTHGTDPNDEDSDDDGLNDQQELFGDTDPNNPDTDGDSCNDGREQLEDFTNPLDPDSHAEDCGGGLEGNDGELLIGAGTTTNFGVNDHVLEVSEIDEISSPKIVYLIIDGEFFESIVAQIIEIAGLEVEVVSIGDGKVKILISTAP